MRDRAINPMRLGKTKAVIDEAYRAKPGLHVHDADLLEVTNGFWSGWEMADTPLLQDFLRAVFAGQEWRREFVTARRIQGFDANSQDWQKPLELHLDSQFHALPFTVNFWIPFDPCGIDAPALRLVPVDYKTTRHYAGFTGKPLRENERWNFGYFAPGALELEAVTKAFGERCFLRPAMQPGDVIIASNWIIHGSYRTPEMTKGRTSAELRFVGSQLDVGAL
jgi:hypothetical protein